MRKKIGMAVLCSALVVSLMGCSASDSNQASAESSKESTTAEATKEPEETKEPETTKEQETAKEPETTEQGDTTAEDTASQEHTDGSVGQALLKDFQERVSADPSLGAQALADAIIENQVITAVELSLMTMAVEPGLLNGFDNAEITGFQEGVSFAPMIGSIPFVGYIFILEEGADAEAFKTTLKENANPRWNICTEADETVIDSVGNTVFFLMCPADFNEE